MDDVNERNTAQVVIKMYDPDGVLAAPTSASYTIHDLLSGTEVRAEEALAVASSVTLTLDANDTKILSVSNKFEPRRITVTAVYGAQDLLTGEYDYRVKNLAFVSSS